ncbi:flagellar basal body P-ring formation chaperone FlgA [Bdellovibrionota bacterium FG-2]
MFKFWAILLVGTWSGLVLSAEIDLRELISKELAKQFTGSDITLTTNIEWLSGRVPEQGISVLSVEENGRGEIYFTVVGEPGAARAQGRVGFSAFVPARVATKRILPGSALSAAQFSEQRINVAVGQAHEFRGLILSPLEEISRLESRQTILEGQPLVSSATQRIPDIRRGDSVRIHLLTSGLLLTAPGIAEEAAYLNQPVRVMATKTKKALLGELKAGGVVEVPL